ncbi:MAG: hypothetical protein KF901_08925 [Myxococcales bacterium]|nr:hypothetical protein [Myxococcales bacterium]
MFILLTPQGAKGDEPLLVSIEHLAAVLPGDDGKARVLVAGRELAVEESVRDVVMAIEDLMESLSDEEEWDEEEEGEWEDDEDDEEDAD